MYSRLTAVLAAIPLLLLSPVQAQVTQYDAGYVITTDGETLHGQVARLIDLEASQRIVFIPDGATEPVEMTVSDAVEYGLETGRRYVLRTFSPSRDVAHTPLFVQVLVEGDLSLYTYALRLEASPTGGVLRDADLYERFAVEDREGNVRGLYQLRAIEGGADAHMRVDRQFARVLAGLYAACPEEQARTAQLRFSRRHLVASVARFNECVGADFAVVDEAVGKRRSDAGFGYTVRAGVGHSRIGGAQGSAGGRVSHYVGGALEYRFRAIPGQSALVLEASLFRRGADDAERLRPGNPENYAKHVLGISLGWRHAFGHATVPYVGAGLTTGIWLGADDPYVEYDEWHFPVDHIEPYSGEMGFFIEAGVDLPYRGARRLSVGLRTEFTGFYHDITPARLFRDLFQSDTGVIHSGGNVSLVAGLRF